MAMQCMQLPLGQAESPCFVVVLSRYRGRILLSRHARRRTWETQGGHIEPGESPEQAARRELWEESGALDYELRPLFDYWAGEDGEGKTGVVFLAEVDRLGPLPASEMAEVCEFDALPDTLTYPAITPQLFAWARQMGAL